VISPLNLQEKAFENLLYGDEEDYYSQETQSLADLISQQSHWSSMKHHHLDGTTTVIFNTQRIYLLDRRLMRYRVLYECGNGHVKQIGKFMKSRVVTRNGER